jgi:leader peptidase (prepilin peptidase) / N-methyltransferase
MTNIWLLLFFIFAFGCCIGSFLNVVIYRLPKEKSLVSPPSSCPSCGRRIKFYDNIPLFSWLLLRARCRYCKSPISQRYFVIELLTGLVFVGLFVLYFVVGVRHFEIDGQMGIGAFFRGGWVVYLVHIILLSALISISAIDLELWLIPVIVCWFATLAGFVGSGLAEFIIKPESITGRYPLPVAGADAAALAAGAAIGLVISLILLATGLIKGSYEGRVDGGNLENGQEQKDEPEFNDRLEVCREVLFLLPIIFCSAAFYWAMRNLTPVWWGKFVAYPAAAGFFGSLWGYFLGCAVVWATRILGTLAFGREAMGLGDVHLMGAAGAVIGPLPVVVAFFLAPFFGLGWVSIQLFFKKIRQIPYGPFLSLGAFTVMIFQDRILDIWRLYTLSFSR